MTEDDTPFRPSKTQTIFKNAANVQLRGSTFDATHMDKFIGSGFGERSIQIGAMESLEAFGNRNTNRTQSYTAKTGPGGGGGSNLMSYMQTGANTIRPSVSFVSMKRDEYKQTKYTDE